MTRQFLFVTTFSLLASTAAFAKGKAADRPAAPSEPPVDISAVRDKLQVLSDGHEHYVVVDPWGDLYKHVYYGDGKTFHALRVSGGGRAGKESWDRVFWEPRVDARWKGGVSFHKDKHKVQCGNRATELTPLPAEEQTKMLESATFYGPLWKYRAYALARDDKGTYYYVDKPREPENNKAYRLFAGKRGSLKPLRMTNIVSDSQGDIFTTKRGELRLVLDLKRPLWVARKKETELVKLPLDENHILIYSDLGVYSGQRLGTPCDDLM
jgi:hypothetical protein